MRDRSIIFEITGFEQGEGFSEAGTMPRGFYRGRNLYIDTEGCIRISKALSQVTGYTGSTTGTRKLYVDEGGTLWVLGPECMYYDGENWYSAPYDYIDACRGPRGTYKIRQSDSSTIITAPEGQTMTLDGTPVCMTSRGEIIFVATSAGLWQVTETHIDYCSSQGEISSPSLAVTTNGRLYDASLGLVSGALIDRRLRFLKKVGSDYYGPSIHPYTILDNGPNWITFDIQACTIPGVVLSSVDNTTTPRRVGLAGYAGEVIHRYVGCTLTNVSAGQTVIITGLVGTSPNYTGFEVMLPDGSAPDLSTWIAGEDVCRVIPLFDANDKYSIVAKEHFTDSDKECVFRTSAPIKDVISTKAGLFVATCDEASSTSWIYHSENGFNFDLVRTMQGFRVTALHSVAGVLLMAGGAVEDDGIHGRIVQYPDKIIVDIFDENAPDADYTIHGLSEGPPYLFGVGDPNNASAWYNGARIFRLTSDGYYCAYSVPSADLSGAYPTGYASCRGRNYIVFNNGKLYVTSDTLNDLAVVELGACFGDSSVRGLPKTWDNAWVRLAAPLPTGTSQDAGVTLKQAMWGSDTWLASDTVTASSGFFESNIGFPLGDAVGECIFIRVELTPSDSNETPKIRGIGLTYTPKYTAKGEASAYEVA